jgi:hypothetical protein
LWLQNVCGRDESFLEQTPAINIQTRDMTGKEWRSIVMGIRPEPKSKSFMYLGNRGVTKGQIEEFDIRVYGDEAGIVVPLTDVYGMQIGCNIRYFGNGKMRYQTLYSGDRQPLFPMHKIPEYKAQEPLLLVEGMFGVLRANSFGHQALALLGDGGLKIFESSAAFIISLLVWIMTTVVREKWKAC